MTVIDAGHVMKIGVFEKGLAVNVIHEKIEGEEYSRGHDSQGEAGRVTEVADATGPRRLGARQSVGVQGPDD